MHSMPSKGVPPDLPHRNAGHGGTRSTAPHAPIVPARRHVCTAFDADDYAALEASPSAAKVVDALLKRPGAITYEIVKGRRASVSALLLGVLTVCMLSYGIVMGFFSGAQQLWAVPAKTTLGFLLSGLLCLPSLYILAQLTGSTRIAARVG